MDLLETHRHEVDKIQGDLIEWIQERKNSGSTEGLTLAYQKHTSNTLRANEYKKKGPRLGIGALNRVLKVDPDKKVALVEPRVTMEQLVDATLEHSLVPAVLPEFKSITVGGAINGAGIESTSHLYGQFNDICNSYEVLLGDGAIITATPKEYSDLFYGIAGAYGTLAVILSVEVQLVPAKPWVLLEYHKSSSVDDVVNTMGALHNQENPPEFLEGIIFSKEKSVAISGRGVDEEELAGIPRLSLKHYWSKWFYHIAQERCHKDITKEAIPIRDYLFRHDRAAFWMGGYALHPLLLFRYIVEYLGHCPKKLHDLLMVKKSKKYHKTRRPSWLFRFLFGWFMDSEGLYNFMHHGTEQWFADHFCIQDYYIPQRETADFVTYIANRYEIFPIWLCPVKPTQSPQLLSPHYSDGKDPELLFDVGVYGLTKDMEPGEAVVYDLDNLTYTIGGKKMFYSHTYFTGEELWRYYSKETYEALRQKYFADGMFLDITEKVLL